jgi:hypothetical protein
MVSVCHQKCFPATDLPDVGAEPGFQFFDVDCLHEITVVTSDYFVKTPRVSDDTGFPCSITSVQVMESADPSGEELLTVLVEKLHEVLLDVPEVPPLQARSRRRYIAVVPAFVAVAGHGLVPVGE